MYSGHDIMNSNWNYNSDDEVVSTNNILGNIEFDNLDKYLLVKFPMNCKNIIFTIYSDNGYKNNGTLSIDSHSTNQTLLVPIDDDVKYFMKFNLTIISEVKNLNSYNNKIDITEKNIEVIKFYEKIYEDSSTEESDSSHDNDPNSNNNNSSVNDEIKMVINKLDISSDSESDNSSTNSNNSVSDSVHNPSNNPTEDETCVTFFDENCESESDGDENSGIIILNNGDCNINGDIFLDNYVNLS